MGYSPWGCKELDTTEWLNNNIILEFKEFWFCFCFVTFKKSITVDNISENISYFEEYCFFLKNIKNY